MVSIKYNGLRKQQILYGVTLLLVVLACGAAGLVSRFQDIEFSAPLLEKYQALRTAATLTLETNIALLVFVFGVLLVDLFRSKAMPVWFELVWTFIFAVVQVGNMVMLVRANPLCCTGAPLMSATGVQFGKRDSIDTTSGVDAYVAGVGANSTEKVLKTATKELVENWAIMFVFFAMIALHLFLQFLWLTSVGLRHRLTHPEFFFEESVPTPYTWNLSSSTSTITPKIKDIETASVTSSDTDSIDEEKKAAAVVNSTVPIVVQVQLPTTRAS